VSSAILVRDLAKSYAAHSGRVEALRNVSFEVPRGSFVSVVGTLLKILAGIAALTSGAAFLEGQALAGPSSRVGVVFQSPVLLPWRTVLDNVLLPIDVRGTPREPARKKALDLLHLTGLDGFEQRYPAELSGGMQQRAAICRALITDPSILLMDEPFGSLDAMTREHMNLELQRLWLERPTTILLITHSIAEAVLLSDRVLVMSARPGTILRAFEVPLPRPRKLSMLNTPEAGTLSTEIRAALGAQTEL
jgi:NitT/TauT family transport system ATP-binding protein